MRDIKTYIAEAVARRSTGKYNTFDKLSMKTTLREIRDMITCTGADKYDITRTDMEDLSMNAERSGRLAYMIRITYNLTSTVYIASPSGVSYVLSITPHGIVQVKRFEYDQKYNDLRCTAEGIGNEGLNRLLGEIKELFINETK